MNMKLIYFTAAMEFVKNKSHTKPIYYKSVRKDLIYRFSFCEYRWKALPTNENMINEQMMIACF